MSPTFSYITGAFVPPVLGVEPGIAAGFGTLAVIAPASQSSSGWSPPEADVAISHGQFTTFHPFARFSADAVHFSSNIIDTPTSDSVDSTGAINGGSSNGGDDSGNGGGDEKIDPIKQEAASIAADIRNEITQWQERYDREGTKEEVERRLSILEGEMAGVQEIGDARDLLDAHKILWNRVIREERRLFRETQRKRSFKVSLYGDKEVETPQKPSKPPSEESIIRKIITKPRQELGAIISALVAKRRAGLEISLRDHQWKMLSGIQEDWAVHNAHRMGWPKLNSVVVAPTGSGKTHVMGAAIELGIKEDWLEFNGGAKAIILTHLKQIGRQNVDRMKELLDPVFRSRYGRDVKISVIGEGVWDTSGDVIIASVPTVGAERNLARLQGSFAGLKNLLVLEDEYHHAVARSWADALSQLKSIVPRGYVIGFTATLPPQERANVNIVAESTPTELMREGVLPSVELYQVFTGVDMQRIPTTRGEFDPAELSRSVRSAERYEHGMRALEFNGVRNPRGGLSPTLIFGVDIAHINELARYYQIYFAKERKAYTPETGLEIKSLGMRHIAVIDDSMPELEIDRILGDHRSGRPSHFTRYETGKLVETGEYVETKIDGVVAVLTGDTSSKVRQKILEASRRGQVEAIINAKVFGEGFDGWWIQNLVGAKPSLKYIQKAQEGGRVLRYGPKEIGPDGRVTENRRRVAIDLIDVRSGLQTYYSVYGVSSASRSDYGRKIDVATGTISSGGGYGGLKDVYDIDGDDIKKRQVAGLKVEELQLVKGEREHYLLSISEAGALGLRLREILNKDYSRYLDEMAFDLAITEEMLVGYMNGGIPEDERIARRMGIFLYKGRGALLDSFTEARLEWTPLDKIPEDRRELVAIARRRVIEAFGGRLPMKGFTTVDRLFSGHLKRSPLHAFLRSGKIKYGRTNAPAQFWRKVNRTLFVEQRSDGIHHIGMDEEAKKLKDQLISKLEGWAPLKEIPEDRRELVAVARRHVIGAFGGKLPEKGFTAVDEYFSGGLVKSSLHDFLRSGKIEYSNNNAPSQFWKKVERVLFVEWRSDGIHHIGMDEDAREVRDKLIAKLENWTPLEEISEDRRELVAIVRKHVIEAFSGRWPRFFTTVDGSFSGYLTYYSPLHAFLRSGKIEYSNANTPTQFWQKVEKTFFVERIDEGGYRHVTPDPRTAELLANLRSIGEAAWRAVSGRGKIVSHPNTN